MPTQDQFYTRVFAVVAITLLLVLLWLILRPLAGTLAWALLLAFLLQPVQARFTSWFHGRAAASALVLTFAALVLFVGPLAALVVTFARQAASLVERLQQTYTLSDVSTASLENIPLIGRALSWIESHTVLTTEQLREWLVSGATTLLQHVGSVGSTLFVGALGKMVGFVMMFFLLFFFLRDGAQMSTRLTALVPMSEGRKHALAEQLGAVTRAVVFGTLLTGLLQGALLGIGFAIVHLPSPVVFAVIAALLSLLPMGGTALVWIPAVLYLLTQGRYGAAIFLALWGSLLVGLMDNLLKPVLISGRAEVPTLAVFLGVIGGLSAFGPIGMFLGPVLLAMTIALLRWAEEHRSVNA
ncbi:MAG TPA: AI-2E family transporter [Steroidobacteraceae bacterium]|jgi:predicted PurR-regulated permease PerM|nr:AI-2E family transporter [Steroidobacteraceae bacterium]